jgi:hypothetical protein
MDTARPMRDLRTGFHRDKRAVPSSKTLFPRPDWSNLIALKKKASKVYS